jgi:hypothetical protein
VAPQLSIPAFLISPAAAAIEVEVGTDQFYDELAAHGDWVWYRGGYVFVPGDVDDRWRPYAVGRWAYTDDYGWMWMSDEPFGWATYHYGRWVMVPGRGWAWMPGTVWAEGGAKMVWIDYRNNKSVSLPDWLRERIA